MADPTQTALKSQITRLRNASKASNLTLAQKLELKAQVKDAEEALRTYRLACLEQPDADGDPDSVTCNRCGAGGLYWIHGLPTADGKDVRSALYENNEHGRPVKHFCKASADDFTDLTKE